MWNRKAFILRLVILLITTSTPVMAKSKKPDPCKSGKVEMLAVDKDRIRVLFLKHAQWRELASQVPACADHYDSYASVQYVCAPGQMGRGYFRCVNPLNPRVSFKLLKGTHGAF